MYSEDVLFLLITIEMEYLQVIGFSLSEQSLNKIINFFFKTEKI